MVPQTRPPAPQLLLQAANGKGLLAGWLRKLLAEGGPFLIPWRKEDPSRTSFTALNFFLGET